jgi:16S rRNA (adenine1518-N6/adenine1519-N6)-dimethyltransferase
MEHPSKILASLGIRARKSLGQNFLADGNIAGKIIENSVCPGDFVLEIGPGTGVLTLPASERAAHVMAVEIDPVLAKYLRDNLSRENVEILEMDFLRFDRGRMEPLLSRAGGAVKVVGNLPYSVSGPIVFKLIELRDCISYCYVMLQKEVAGRLASPPGSKEYGALSVILQAVAGVSILFNVSRNSFFPIPEVDSAFLEIDFTRGPVRRIENFRTFVSVVNAAFEKRRKTMKNALKGLLKARGFESDEAMERLFDRAGIDPRKRPERISAGDFINLANLFEEGIS